MIANNQGRCRACAIIRIAVTRIRALALVALRVFQPACGSFRSAGALCDSSRPIRAALVRLRVRTNSGVEVPIGQRHWLSVAEGNCVAERRGGEQPEANDQSIIKKMMNSIRPDALASLLAKGEAQNGSRPGKGTTATPRPTCGENSERSYRSAWGGWR